MKTRKGSMEVGKRYRGYGVLNEYGEFSFEPENTGARAGVIKQIATRDGVTLSHTNNNVIVHIKVAKNQSQTGYLRDILSKVDVIISLLKEYGI